MLSVHTFLCDKCLVHGPMILRDGSMLQQWARDRDSKDNGEWIDYDTQSGIEPGIQRHRKMKRKNEDKAIEKQRADNNQRTEIAKQKPGMRRRHSKAYTSIAKIGNREVI
eukprot:Opistho-2@76881